jgi:hypothetical protein
VVFPTPGGPHNIIEGIIPESNARRKDASTDKICSCPMYSSKVFGRIRSARGAEIIL